MPTGDQVAIFDLVILATGDQPHQCRQSIYIVRFVWRDLLLQCTSHRIGEGERVTLLCPQSTSFDCKRHRRLRYISFCCMRALRIRIVRENAEMFDMRVSLAETPRQLKPVVPAASQPHRNPAQPLMLEQAPGCGRAHRPMLRPIHRFLGLQHHQDGKDAPADWHRFGSANLR